MLTPEKLGENIKNARKERGLTQAELAALIGKTIRTTAKYERGESDITVTDLNTVSAALNTSIEKLLDIPEKMNLDTLEDLLRVIDQLTCTAQTPFISTTDDYEISNTTKNPDGTHTEHNEIIGQKFSLSFLLLNESRTENYNLQIKMFLDQLKSYINQYKNGHISFATLQNRRSQLFRSFSGKKLTIDEMNPMAWQLDNLENVDFQPINDYTNPTEMNFHEIDNEIDYNENAANNIANKLNALEYACNAIAFSDDCSANKEEQLAILKNECKTLKQKLQFYKKNIEDIRNSLLQY